MIQEETIEKASTGFWGRNDCEDRSQMALDKFPVFFNDTNHISRTEQVLGIVSNFFRIKKGVYINHRVGTKNSGPFTAIKVDDPVFPNGMKQSQKDEVFYTPLEQLGVKIVYNKGTNSYLFHIH
jgi:hypothetical protein